MRVEIVVDELVLRGVPNERAAEVAAALEARLVALGEDSARRGARLAPREEAFRRAPDVQARSSSPGALGDAVAGSVWGAVARGART
jgi:hypothetical protein